MDLISIVQNIEASALGEWMRTSVKAMPVVEAIHVMAIAVVFGTIFIVDLRLLGLRDTRRPYSQVSGEMLHWTWAAFVVAVITGAMMFAANATTYFDNSPFRWKMLALLGAGVNMAVFQMITARDAIEWEFTRSAPPAGRVAGALSILLWTSVIFLGRWIGFTKGYDFGIPDDIELDFDFFDSGVQDLRWMKERLLSPFG
jgi:hypothetical protein